MKLWIRSQNKDRIVKANAVMVTTFQELVAIHCYIDKDTSVWLGNYTTKERALEVLDEIQNILQPKPLVIVRPSEEMVELLGDRQVGKTMKMKQDFEFKELSTYVYQMPEE